MFFKGINPNPEDKTGIALADADCISASYYNLLANEPAEVLFEPQIGFGLVSLLFKSLDSPEKYLLESKLRKYLNINEPRGLITNLETSFYDNVLDIQIQWKPNIRGVSNPKTFHVNFSFS